MLRGKVLVTGGSGFLGRGILRRATKEKWPAEFTVYSRDEYKQDVCRRKYPHARYVLGSITDTERLAITMAGHDTVIHAAALKYIPEGEFNASECVAVNVDGTRSIIKAARQARIGRVVAISTDKAVHPINVYGMTKALMERLMAEATTEGYTKFTTCRYGNVVGSTGSVIPVFLRQIREEGKVTITNPDMTRFWISVDEAVDLILLAHSVDCAPGATVIPEPRSMRLGELASALVGKYGTKGTRIEYIGMRAGEKLHEDLLHDQEALRTIAVEDHYQLLPVGTRMPAGLSMPSTLSSSSPKEWVTADKLVDMIEDAKCV